VIKRKFRIEAIPGFAVKFYDLIARKNPVIRDIHRDVAEEVSAQISSGRLLDIGTGPGYVPFEIAKRAPGLEIVGIDLSGGMVKAADKHAKELGLSDRVTFKVANAGSLPFEDGHFDFVISTLSFHHWSKPVEYIKEIHRVLKNNGQAWIYDIWRDTPKEIDEQVRKKYGWFYSFLFLTAVRAHSSITLRVAEETFSSLGDLFTEKSTQARGAILKLRLLK
jgi:ubiquinone/menaquinone biosynthesis C-methylase UbiE